MTPTSNTTWSGDDRDSCDPRPGVRARRETKHLTIINASNLETGTLKGAEHGATISLILDHSEPAAGPRLHRHPYDETWVVQEGHLTFQLGDERFKAGPGDIVIAPPGIPHKFTNDGPRRSSLVCIQPTRPWSRSGWNEVAAGNRRRMAERAGRHPTHTQCRAGRSGPSVPDAAGGRVDAGVPHGPQDRPRVSAAWSTRVTRDAVRARRWTRGPAPPRGAVL